MCLKRQTVPSATQITKYIHFANFSLDRRSRRVRVYHVVYELPCGTLPPFVQPHSWYHSAIVRPPNSWSKNRNLRHSHVTRRSTTNETLKSTINNLRDKVLNLLSLVLKSESIFETRHPTNPNPPAWASIMEVPTGVPTLSPNSEAALADRPSPTGVPGGSTTFPIFLQLFFCKSPNPTSWKYLKFQP
jgi:hypothetical protein